MIRIHRIGIDWMRSIDLDILVLCSKIIFLSMEDSVNKHLISQLISY